MPPTLRKLPLVLLLAAVAWLAFGFGSEARSAFASLAAPPDPGELWRWRLGDPTPTDFGLFLLEAGRAARPGSLIALATSTGSPTQDFFLGMWTAYGLPRNRVVLRSSPAAADAEYVVTYTTLLDEPGLEEILRRAPGALYRVARPPAPP